MVSRNKVENSVQARSGPVCYLRVASRPAEGTIQARVDVKWDARVRSNGDASFTDEDHSIESEATLSISHRGAALNAADRC